MAPFVVRRTFARCSRPTCVLVLTVAAIQRDVRYGLAVAVGLPSRFASAVPPVPAPVPASAPQTRSLPSPLPSARWRSAQQATSRSSSSVRVRRLLVRPITELKRPPNTKTVPPSQLRRLTDSLAVGLLPNSRPNAARAKVRRKNAHACRAKCKPQARALPRIKRGKQRIGKSPTALATTSDFCAKLTNRAFGFLGSTCFSVGESSGGGRTVRVGGRACRWLGDGCLARFGGNWRRTSICFFGFTFEPWRRFGVRRFRLTSRLNGCARWFGCWFYGRRFSRPSATMGRVGSRTCLCGCCFCT